jgi:hypothetical protein
MPDTPNHPETPRQDGAGTKPHIRALAVEFEKNALIDQDGGGLLITGVPMLAEGTWTDSSIGTPLFYPSDTLREYAENWIDTTGWSRHFGGSPRDATDKVAELTNPRYEDGAIRGDILVHGATQKSRDLVELLKRKLIAFVSVEHGGDERYNAETRQQEASSLEFYGFAFVHRGACKLCRINEEKAPEPEQPPEEVETMTDELIDRIAELEKKLGAMEAAAKPPEEDPKVEIEKELAAMKEQIKELAKAKEEAKALSERIKALESDGEARTGQVQGRELGDPINSGLTIDRKTGTIRRG